MSKVVCEIPKIQNKEESRGADAAAAKLLFLKMQEHGLTIMKTTRSYEEASAMSIKNTTLTSKGFRKRQRQRMTKQI